MSDLFKNIFCEMLNFQVFFSACHISPPTLPCLEVFKNAWNGNTYEKYLITATAQCGAFCLAKSLYNLHVSNHLETLHGLLSLITQRCFITLRTTLTAFPGPTQHSLCHLHHLLPQQENIAVPDAKIWQMLVLTAISTQLFSQLFKNHIQSVQKNWSRNQCDPIQNAQQHWCTNYNFATSNCHSHKTASLFGGGQLSISQTSGGISRGRLACQTAGCVQEQKNLNVEVGWRNQ